MLLVPFFLTLKILTPTLKAALFPLQGRNSEQHHLKLMPHFLLAFILKDLGLDPRPSKWMRIFPLTSGTVEEGTDKASCRSYHCSLERKSCNLGGLCAKTSKNLTGLFLSLARMRAHLLFCSRYWEPSHRSGNPFCYYDKKHKQFFCCWSGFEEALNELDLSKGLRDITVLCSLRSVNSLEVEESSNSIIGWDWKRRHAVRLFWGTMRERNLLSAGIISKGCSESPVSWHTDLDWKFAGVSSEIYQYFHYLHIPVSSVFYQPLKRIKM